MLTQAEQHKELETHKLSMIKLEGAKSQDKLLCVTHEVGECGSGLGGNAGEVNL